MADAYQALYRRYRARRFADQRGQDHVMRALRTAVEEDRVGHAYLFSGPRGTGKTSTARILAKALNCDNPSGGEPDGTCPNCIAVEEGRIVDWLLELDAASNNGVGAIRDLIERIPLGTSGNRKVVILDEVHMLSTGASNALLKSLEEPPAHVLFILATTDPQKVLPTIRSRAQHFEFHLLPAEELTALVRHVIDDAGLGLDEDAVNHVVRAGGGSARDTLSALDQVAAMGGVVDEAQPVEEILEAIAAEDAAAALAAVAEASASGRDPRTLGETLITALRDAFLAEMGAPDRHLPDGDRDKAKALGHRLGAARLTRSLEVLGEALVELGKKPDPRIVLEVALVRLCRPDADRSLDALLDRIDRLERTIAAVGAGNAQRHAPLPAPPPAGTAPQVAEPAPSSSDPHAVASGAPSPGAAERAAVAAKPPEPAAPGAPAGPQPGAGPAASRRGPAAEARERLAELKSAQPEPARPYGAVKKAAPPATPAPQAPSRVSPAAQAPPEVAASPAPDGDGSGPTQAEVEAAWDDVLAALKPGTRAVFATGHFGSGPPGAVVFALQNAPTRDHCEKRRPEVEAALAARFGRPVPIQLVSADDGGGGPRPPAQEVASPPADDEISIDVSELEDAPDAGTGVERLAQAFPGAELVEEP